MTAKAKQVTSAASSPAPVILFGIDSNGKPKAARFGKDHAHLAIKAARQLQLRVLTGNDPKVADLVTRLPVGRIHATGKTFVPFIRRDLYDKLVAAAPNGNHHETASSPPSGAGGTTGAKPPGASSPSLPKTWREIGLGDLVVAHQSPDDGWYEAIVAEMNGDMLTLRWRDYPQERRIVRHRNQLALLSPGSNPAEPRKLTKPASGANDNEPTNADQNGNAEALPKSWQEIDVNQLVLAKDDGPWLSWWEAIPVEKAGDEIRLRWRNRINKSVFTRQRLELALICPDAVSDK